MEINKCPYCKKKLEKVPLKKKKCEFCGKYIYPRSRPKTKGKVLVTENELKKIEAEWIKYALSHKWFKILEKFGVTKNDYLMAQEDLRKKFNMFPFITDVYTYLFEHLRLDCYKSGDIKKVKLIEMEYEKFRKEREKKKILFE